jgi:hypothetical protein
MKDNAIKKPTQQGQVNFDSLSLGNKVRVSFTYSNTQEMAFEGEIEPNQPGFLDRSLSENGEIFSWRPEPEHVYKVGEMYLWPAGRVKKSIYLPNTGNYRNATKLLDIAGL